MKPKIQNQNQLKTDPNTAKPTSLEQQIYSYKWGEPINTFSEPDARQAIGSQLNIIFQLIGLKDENYPSLDAKKEIADFVRTNYGHLCPAEIKLAFNVAFQKVTPSTDSRIKTILDHYQSFSIPYLKGILEFYLRCRFTAIEKVEKKIIVIDKKDSVGRLNDRTYKKILLRIYWEIINDRPVTYTGALATVGNFLWYIGQMNWSQEEIKEFFDQAKQEIQEVKSKEIARRQKKGDADLEPTKVFEIMNVSERAGTIAVITWLREKAMEEISWIALAKIILSHCYIKIK